MKLSEVADNPMSERAHFRAARIVRGQLTLLGVDPDGEVYQEVTRDPDGNTTAFRLGCAIDRGLFLVKGSLNELDSDLYDARASLLLWSLVTDYKLEVISKDGNRQTAILTIAGQTFDGSGWGRTENLLAFAKACEDHLGRHHAHSNA
jgi:hypothetical protein